MTHTVTTKWLPPEGEELYEIIKEHPYRNQHMFQEPVRGEALCWSISYRDDRPYLISCARSRDFYQGMIRLVSHYAVHPDYSMDRKGWANGRGMRLDAIDHIDQQRSLLGKGSYFIAREDKSPNQRRQNEIYENIVEYSLFEDWKKDGKCLVAPNPNNPACWQYVIYNDYNYLPATYE